MSSTMSLLAECLSKFSPTIRSRLKFTGAQLFLQETRGFGHKMLGCWTSIFFEKNTRNFNSKVSKHRRCCWVYCYLRQVIHWWMMRIRSVQRNSKKISRLYKGSPTLFKTRWFSRQRVGKNGSCPILPSKIRRANCLSPKFTQLMCTETMILYTNKYIKTPSIHWDRTKSWGVACRSFATHQPTIRNGIWRNIIKHPYIHPFSLKRLVQKLKHGISRHFHPRQGCRKDQCL